jgi:parallel beta-helix repeat protein
MYANLWKKGMVLAIICLFIGAGAVPSTSSYIETDYKKYTNHIENLVLDDQIDQQQTETEDALDAKIPFGTELDDNIIVLAQSFKPTFPMLTKVDLLLCKKMSSNGITVSIKESLDSDESLASIQKGNSQISNYPSWTTFDFYDVDVIPDETYYVVCTTDASVLLMTYEWHYGYRSGEPIDNYDRGIAHIFQNNVWDSWEETDFCFKTYGIPSENQYPVANFNWTPKNPKINEMITFNASSSYDPDGNIANYEWDWNSDGVYDESHTIPATTHTWSVSGSYYVTLKVTDNGELANFITKTVFVYNLIVPDDYPTIQEAVDNSQRGYSIYVRAGDPYNENIVIDLEMITIKGENNKNTIIDGSGEDDVIHITYDAPVTDISGFTIQNSGSSYAGIRTESDYNILTENRIIGNGDAVIMYKSNGNSIQKNIINNNTYGITIDTNSHAINITDNNIMGNKNHGIQINEKSTGFIISNNAITHNGECGICINDVSHSTIVTWNKISNNDIGIKSYGFSDGNLFHQNSIIDNDLNAFDSSIDHWDNYVFGNYWSDYDGEDENEDGIGDTPYYIPGGDNKDRYPLMKPWQPPSKPGKPLGKTNGKAGREYEYMTSSVDQNGDRIKYGWDWGDESGIEWTGYYNSGETAIIAHKYKNEGSHRIRVIAKDENHQKSDWSEPLAVSMPKQKTYGNMVNNFLLTYIFNQFYSLDKIKYLIKTLKNDDLFLNKNQKGDYPNCQISKSTFTGDTIYVPDDYTTIQEAVNNAMDGDKIVVRAGTYNEHIIIDKSLNITGENSDNTFVDGGGECYNVFNVQVDNVQISNFTIMNCNESKAGIGLINKNYLNVSGCRINDNVLLECGSGIELFWTNNNTIFNNTISGNYAWGLYSFSSNNCTIENNTIAGNFIGIEPDLSSLIIKNNKIEYNNDSGIYQFLCCNEIIENNTICNNNDKGVRIFSSKNNKIIHNKITGNLNNGITLHDSNSNIFYINTIRSDSGNSKLTILGYSSLNSNLGISVIFRSCNNLFHLNNFAYLCTAYDKCYNDWDYEELGNYWNDYQGADNNGDGIGDIPYNILGGENTDSYPLMVPWE